MKRIWIYQSNRLLTDEECERIGEILQEFVQQWKAHGNQLCGSFEIRYNLFIFLKVDESKATVTGCSIDKSVHLLKKIESELHIVLFDRMQIAYRTKDTNELKVVSGDTFRQLIEAGDVDENSTVYNNMLTEASEVDTKWEVPLRDSWHAKVF